MSYGQIGSALTGTIAATTNGALWILRFPELPANVTGEPLEIRRMHVHWTTLAAFSGLVTASRGLKLLLAKPDQMPKAVLPTGGAAFSLAHKLPGDNETLAHGVVATTTALTTSGYTLRPDVRARMSLVHAGAAGASFDQVWRFDGIEAEPLWLPTGWLAVLATEGALDAGGTGQLKVDVDARTLRRD